MENPFRAITAAKSDEALLNIIQQKHRYEPEAYLAALEELERRQLATPELLQEKENVITALKNPPAAKPDKTSWKDSLALLKITKGYFYTPIIIYANVLIWIIMIATGVHAFEPTVESLLSWGGNLSALSINGEPWRLLTSTFLHGGIFHLILNMFALLQVGAILETNFGKHRYALIYIATGIFASIASAAFSENVVSVGASGAIFGLYGLFLSLLITKSIDITGEARKNFIYSTLTFIGYNVAFGFAKAGIDNAAHIGGLLSGFIIGFLYYPAIKQPKLSTAISAALVVAVGIAVWAAPSFIDNKYAAYQSAIQTFVAKEEKAMWMYKEDFPIPGTEEATRFRERLQTEGIDLWKENLALLHTLKDLPSNLQERVDLLIRYCELRIETCEGMQLLTERESAEETNHVIEVSKQIEEIINKLDAMN